MEVSLIDIGTSKGIRIPKSILKLFNSPVSFNLEVINNKIVLETKPNPREGWENIFKKQNDESLLIQDTLDIDEWDKLDD